MNACSHHDPWKRRKTAKSCKGETRVPNVIIGTNQLRETTPTEKPRSSKEAGVEHKASNLVSKKTYLLKNLDNCRESQDFAWVVALIKKFNCPIATDDPGSVCSKCPFLCLWILSVVFHTFLDLNVSYKYYMGKNGSMYLFHSFEEILPVFMQLSLQSF